MGFFDKDIDQEFPIVRNMEFGGQGKPKTPRLTKAANTMEDLYSQDIKYPLQGVAGLSDFENRGLSGLSDIMAGKAFRDPRTSPYYQSVREEGKRLTDEGASALRHRQNRAGAYNASTAINQEGDYRADMGNKIMGVLGQLFEAESARDNPYTRLQAGMTYGSLPRMIEQSGMDAGYNQSIQNLLAPFQLQAPLMQALLGVDPLQTANTFIQPSQADKWGQVMEMIGMGAQAGGKKGLGLWGGTPAAGGAA